MISMLKWFIVAVAIWLGISLSLARMVDPDTARAAARAVGGGVGVYGLTRTRLGWPIALFFASVAGIPGWLV
jgi:hypothetical protein